MKESFSLIVHCFTFKHKLCFRLSVLPSLLVYMLPIIFVEFWAARNRKMCVLEFQFFEKTFTLWLKKLWGLGRNEALSYLGSELFAKKNLLTVSNGRSLFQCENKVRNACLLFFPHGDSKYEASLVPGSPFMKIIAQCYFKVTLF